MKKDKAVYNRASWGSKSKEKPFEMVKNESSGEETIVEIELKGLVRKLELLENEIVKCKKVLKKRVNQMRKIKWNKKWNYS